MSRTQRYYDHVILEKLVNLRSIDKLKLEESQLKGIKIHGTFTTFNNSIVKFFDEVDKTSHY